MKIEIKNRWTNEVIYDTEAESLRAAVANVVRDLVSLADACLAGAYLAGAYLVGATLADAYLVGVFLVQHEKGRDVW